MAISEAYSDIASIGTTEWSLTNGSAVIAAQTADGVYQCFIDAVNVIDSDVFELKVYEKVRSGSSQRLVETFLIQESGAPVFCTPCIILLHGWDFTLLRTGGSNRTLSWSIRKIG